MLRKNLPLYILVVLTLAALLFLSPKIIGIISADSEVPATGTELLTNNHFDQETFNSQTWSMASANQNSGVAPSTGAINIACGQSEGDYVKIAQVAPTIAGKFYKLGITYVAESATTGIKAQFGFLKDSATANVIESKPIDITAGSTSFTTYAAPKLNHENSFFFFKCTGKNSIKVTGFSVEQYSVKPVAMVTVSTASLATATSSPIKPTTISATTTSTSPAATATATRAISTATSTPVVSSTAAAPVQSTTAQTQLITPTPIGNLQTMQSGWNIFGSGSDVSSQVFTTAGMTAMQMFAGKWTKIVPSSKKEMILSSQGGIYVFNPSKSTKNVTLTEPTTNSALIAGKGWNILYNSSNTETSIDDLKYNFSSSGKSDSYSIGDLINQNHASKIVYLLKQTSAGVGLTRIDITQTNKIPAKTGFWFYLFSL
jgi:hypothetical protein